MKDSKKKLWKAAQTAGIYGWFLGFVVLLSGMMYTDDGFNPSWVWLVLWIIVPIFWMSCSGYGLHDHYSYELGLRKRPAPGGGVYVTKEDTTPGKRILLQWLAPFALCYFIIRDKRRKHQQVNNR